MNFDPDLSPTAAIVAVLFASSLWGSWFIALKYLRGYPVDAFLLSVMGFSVVFVWTVGFIVDGSALLGNMASVAAQDASRLWVTVLCGIIYVFGMRLSLLVANMLGLSLAQPIQSSINIFVGTLVSIGVGGLPQGASLSRILLAAIVLVGAVVMSMLAGRYRVRGKRPLGNLVASAGGPREMSDMWRGLTMALLASAFIPAYSFGLSYGLQSTTQPNGLAVMPFMALLATGAVIGAFLSCGWGLTRRHEWGVFREAGVKIHRLGVFAGLCHYGGNIIQAFATAQISSAISWPLGMTSGLWTQLWGLAYGELKGVPRMAYITLGAAVVLYLIAVALLASTLYATA